MKLPSTRVLVPLVVAAVAIAGVFAFGVFEIQSAFIDKEVAEAPPDFGDAGSVPLSTTTESTVLTTGPTGLAPSTPSTSSTSSTSSTTAAAVAVVREVGRAEFAAVEHDGSGSVVLLSDGERSVVRFEDDFTTENGPDLYAVAVAGDRRVELGELKGNRGSQNYDVPPDVDPDAITEISVWCKRFDATFTTARL